MAGDEKTCPFCAETIKAAAVVCKHCGRDLPSATTEPALSADVAEKVKLYKIERAGAQWLYRGNKFDLVEGAIRMAESGASMSVGSAPAAASSARQPARWWLWPLVAGALFVVWALARTPSPEDDEKSADRGVIEACWKEQGKKSYDAEAARFIAGACEKAEKDFRAKYGVSP